MILAHRYHHNLLCLRLFCSLIIKLQSSGRSAPITVGFFIDFISWYSLGSSCNITEVRQVQAAGEWLSHLPEPRAKPLETDLGTYADKTQSPWMLFASQADRGASGGRWRRDHPGRNHPSEDVSNRLKVISEQRPEKWPPQHSRAFNTNIISRINCTQLQRGDKRG